MYFSELFCILSNKINLIIRERLLIFIKIIIFSVLGLQGQDTTFVRSHAFESSVNNIDGDGKNLIVRTQNKLYVLTDGKFEEIRRVNLRNGRYTWIKSQGNLSRVATYNSTLLPQNKLVAAESIRHLLPGSFHSNITKASIGNTFYLNYKGNLLEYHINNFYFIAHREKSVRSVYTDDSIRIISSYSGVFIDRDYRLFTNETLPGGNYANGETFKINGTYYLCKDYLYQLKNNRWEKVPIPGNDPAFIKMKELEQRVLFLASNRIGYIDLQSVTLDKTCLNLDHN